MEDKLISSETADWSREFKTFFSWRPSRSLLASIRSYQRHKKSTTLVSLLLSKFSVLRHRFWSVITGAEIPLNAKIGGGLLLPHPNGVVIHHNAVVGPNCLIFQQVTIGSRGGDGVPIIGGHVDIGAGAKILGPVRIGNHVLIGANAVVTKDIPDNGVAVGIPAVVLPAENKAIM